MHPMTHSSIHHYILNHIIEHGHAPSLLKMATQFHVSIDAMTRALEALQDYHGVVLHPHNSEVWVIHPFALAPTPFLVKSKRGQWWGNCAWCSFGVAALLNEDCTITTNSGAYDEKITIQISDGQIDQPDLYVHFPIPMSQAWDNVIYTCSTMLLFRTEEEVSNWSKRHNIPMGDIQTARNIWEFSKKWYGNHLDENWKKWTTEEAISLFKEFGLTHDVWNIESRQTRF